MESTNPQPQIRWAKKDDAIYPQSFRGLTVVLEDKVIAVAGVLHTNPYQAFSTMDEELRKYPKTIIKTARKFREILNSYDVPIYAIPSDKYSNSERFLQYVGFEQLDNGIFRWNQ